VQTSRTPPARIIAYVSPTIDDEGELQEQYNIDPAAIIFKRPRSEHSSRGQLHQEIVVGAEACTEISGYRVQANR
jgi:hypothetical protein